MGRHNRKNQECQSAAQGRAGGLFGTLEWLIMAVSLTLIFIVFQMQAYTIPTGSMADTLKGAHFRLRCSQCGYKYDYNFQPNAPCYRMPDNYVPRTDVLVGPDEPRCPSCGYYLQVRQRMSVGGYNVWAGEKRQVTKGDRIFVLKCMYQLTEPKRWDVVVFKNPLNPRENYIKRMIATPGEMVEIIDGDVYIDGRIARKPAKVQEELWMCVYNNDYQPAKPKIERFNKHLWQQPFRNERGSNWSLKEKNQTVFSLDDPTGKAHTIMYDTNIGNDFKATYAYDDSGRYQAMPICSDLMIRFYVGPDSKGVVGAGLSKYGIRYEGWVDLDVNYSHSDDKVYACMEQRFNYPDADPFCVDTNTTDQEHSWQNNGTGWRRMDTGDLGDINNNNLMLRLRVTPNKGIRTTSLGVVKALYR